MQRSQQSLLLDCPYSLAHTLFSRSLQNRSHNKSLFTEKYFKTSSLRVKAKANRPWPQVLCPHSLSGLFFQLSSFQTTAPLASWLSLHVPGTTLIPSCLFQHILFTSCHSPSSLSIYKCVTSSMDSVPATDLQLSHPQLALKPLLFTAL